MQAGENVVVKVEISGNEQTERGLGSIGTETVEGSGDYNDRCNRELIKVSTIISGVQKKSTKRKIQVLKHKDHICRICCFVICIQIQTHRKKYRRQ